MDGASFEGCLLMLKYLCNHDFFQIETKPVFFPKNCRSQRQARCDSKAKVKDLECQNVYIV